MGKRELKTVEKVNYARCELLMSKLCDMEGHGLSYGDIVIYCGHTRQYWHQKRVTRNKFSHNDLDLLESLYAFVKRNNLSGLKKVHALLKDSSLMLLSNHPIKQDQ